MKVGSVAAFLCGLPLLMAQMCGGMSLNPPDGSPPAGDHAPTTTQPVAVTVDDFNGDFALDVASANFGDDSASVWLNDGDGGFTSAGKLGAGDGPTGIVAADFNADGRRDLAVCSTVSGIAAAIVFLGRGDGTFATGTAFPGGQTASSIAAGDLDRADGPDLVLVNSQAGTLSLLFNDGTGRFGAALELPAGLRPSAVALADLDRDGDLDLAFADHDSDSVGVLRNLSGGNFLPALTFPAGPAPSWIAAGDIDGDGDLDLVTTNQGSPDDAAPDSISVLSNNGNGTFTTARSFAAGINPRFVACADLNGDELQDLAIADFGLAGQGAGVAVLLNGGGLTFVSGKLYAAGTGPLSLAVGSIDPDPAADIVVADFAGNAVRLLTNDGAGAFTLAE